MKIGIGLAAGAVAGAVALRAYQKAEESLRFELVDAVREVYGDREIDVVWIFDEPIRPGIFTGGLIVEDKIINFEVEEGSMRVYELEETAEDAIVSPELGAIGTKVMEDGK